MTGGTIDIVHPFSGDVPPRLACLLGSFDPPHRGHEYLVARLLDRFERVLLLVPRRHFDKGVRAGVNADYSQRLELLGTVCGRHPGRVAAGATDIVLFLELGPALEARFAGTEVVFGMGNDTYARVADSASYYARIGVAIGDEQARDLARLLRRILVFGRSRQRPGDLVVPAALRGVSSTLVRARVRALWQRGAGEDAWQAGLGELVSPEVRSLIRARHLYTG